MLCWFINIDFLFFLLGSFQILVNDFFDFLRTKVFEKLILSLFSEFYYLFIIYLSWLCYLERIIVLRLVLVLSFFLFFLLFFLLFLQSFFFFFWLNRNFECSFFNSLLSLYFSLLMLIFFWYLFFNSNFGFTQLLLDNIFWNRFLLFNHFWLSYLLLENSL